MRKYTHRGATAALALATLFITGTAPAQQLTYSAVKPGYTVSSIELGQPFGGAIAAHPTDRNILYVSVGGWGANSVLEVTLDTGATRAITPTIGAIGGLAVLANGDLAITDNGDATYDTILRARDLNADGDFLDDGEITQLIEPILADFSFTGAHMTVAPAGNAAGIPAGALLVQTADGGAGSEVLVITNPETAPAYAPPGGAYYSGFMYNGGLAFTPAGYLLVGISEFPTGKINALINSNADDVITPDEVRTIVDDTVLANSVSDIAVTAGNQLLTTENSGLVRMFDLPADLATGSVGTPETLVETNAVYLATVCLDDPAAPFSPGTPGQKVTAYVGGFAPTGSATNLLAITPRNTTAAADWQMFE